MSRGLLLFITLIQAIIVLGHAIAYAAVSYAIDPLGVHSGFIAWTFAGLSAWFMAATLVTMRGYRPLAAYWYAAAAVWMGTLSLLVWASGLMWAAWAAAQIAGVTIPLREAMGALLAAALAASAWGAVRSFRPKVARYRVNIPALPFAWHGRKAVLVSDIHFGAVRGAGTARRLADMIARERPDIVFIPGDVFDGVPVPYDALAAALSKISAPLGVFFCEGNHEEFRDPSTFRNAIAKAGIRHLHNEWVEIDGIAIAGIAYQNSLTEQATSGTLRAMHIPSELPKILLKHVPDHQEAVAAADISLMLSGHTHLGQMWPYTHVARRAYNDAAYGHWKFKQLQGITTSGFGTWGPPQRIGTSSEMAVIEFSASHPVSQAGGHA